MAGTVLGIITKVTQFYLFDEMITKVMSLIEHLNSGFRSILI